MTGVCTVMCFADVPSEQKEVTTFHFAPTIR